MRETTALRVLGAARDSGLIPPSVIDRTLAEARRSSRDPLDVATSSLRLPREALYRALAEQKGVPFLAPADLDPDAPLLRRAPAHLLLRKKILPLRMTGESVLVATSDPDDGPTLQALQRAFGVPLSLAVAEPTALEGVLRRLLPGEGQVDVAFEAVPFLDDLLRQACLRRASDLHFDPQPEGTLVRMRVDGHLVTACPPLANDDAAAVISRVKVLGGLDIAERREPQDGGFRYPVPTDDVGELDVRLATIPTRLGERATLRLLGAESVTLTIERLGFEASDLESFREALTQPHGMVLLSGPTGSGKTTTLYAALQEIATPSRNVLTVEDPVERLIPGVSQIPVDRAGKVTFAGALRSLLRHDPDVMMVGEIRDSETADVAIKAAMTGHLVLSSLHANRAAGAPGRLRNMGCPDYLLGAVLRAIVAQRLVRRLCERCRVAQTAPPEQLALLAADRAEETRVWVAQGCPACVGTGYRGRLALVEGVWFDDELAQAVVDGETELELRSRANRLGMRDLADDALTKVLDGRTSLSEARVARS